MADVPITFRGMMYPRDKSLAPYPFTALGVANITGLSVGGGPILPPDEVPPIEPPGEPPLEIWPGPGPIFPIEPHPEHPIFLPDPILPPVDPPAAPVPPHEGWNWSHAKAGWYYLYVPGPTDPGPHR